MALLPIYTHPDPVLRVVCEPVDTINDIVRHLMDDMLETMYDAPGIGLAAPQIGITKRIIVMDLHGGRDGGAKQPLYVINPEIIATSTELTMLEEGCLSLPEMDCEVIRPDAVTVRFLDQYGHEQIIEATGLLAKCFQHEIDHLNGKLIFDHLSPLKRNTTLRRYNKLQRDR